MYTVHCTVIATCIMCTLYTRVGAWVSPPEVENELLKCCLYTLQGGVEGGCPPPLSFSFSCPGQYKPCTGPGLGWSCLACFRSFQKSAPDESSRMSHQWWVIPDDSSLMTHQAQTSGSFQSRKGKGNKNICCLESIKGIAVEHQLSSPLAAKGATPLQKGWVI